MHQSANTAFESLALKLQLSRPWEGSVAVLRNHASDTLRGGGMRQRGGQHHRAVRCCCLHNILASHVDRRLSCTPGFHTLGLLGSTFFSRSVGTSRSPLHHRALWFIVLYLSTCYFSCIALLPPTLFHSATMAHRSEQRRSFHALG